MQDTLDKMHNAVLETPRDIQVDSYLLAREILAMTIGAFAEGLMAFAEGLFRVERKINPYE